MKGTSNRMSGFMAILFVSLLFAFSSGSAESAEPIILGAAVSLTGNLARSGLDQKLGYDLWKETVNAKGGILGRKVDLRIYDDRSEPMTGSKLYEKLISSDKVDLLVGPYGSGVTAAVSTAVEKHKMVMIAPGASSKEIWERGYKYVFQMITPARYQLTSSVEIAKNSGYKTFVVINADSAFPRDLAKGALEDIKTTGLKLLLHEEYPEKANDLSSLVLKIKAAAPDVLIAGSYLPDSVLFVRQAKAASLTPKMIQFGPVGPSIPDFVKSLVGPTLMITQTDDWAGPGPDGVRTGTTVAEIAGAPVRFTAALRLEPTATGARQAVAGELKASVPLVGGKIERAAEPAILAAIRAEQRTSTAWLTRR